MIFDACRSTQFNNLIDFTTNFRNQKMLVDWIGTQNQRKRKGAYPDLLYILIYFHFNL